MLAVSETGQQVPRLRVRAKVRAAFERVHGVTLIAPKALRAMISALRPSTSEWTTPVNVTRSRSTTMWSPMAWSLSPSRPSAA